MEVYTFHTILPAWLVKQIQLSFGHVTIGSNQMIQKHLSRGVIGHCEKLHPQDECPLLPGYMSPLFSCVHVGCMLSFDPCRTKRPDLQQICNRSVSTKTDQLQTSLSSAESVFSLLQTLSLNTLRDVNTADAKQTNNRSADYLQRLQMICNTLKPKNRYYR